MKKILLNSDWYFKYKTIGNKAADIPGQMITLPHDAMIGLDCSEDGDRKKDFIQMYIFYIQKRFIYSQSGKESISLFSSMEYIRIPEYMSTEFMPGGTGAVMTVL
jgi:hypothetical protein